MATICMLFKQLYLFKIFDVQESLHLFPCSSWLCNDNAESNAFYHPLNPYTTHVRIQPRFSLLTINLGGRLGMRLSAEIGGNYRKQRTLGSLDMLIGRPVGKPRIINWISGFVIREGCKHSLFWNGQGNFEFNQLTEFEKQNIEKVWFCHLLPSFSLTNIVYSFWATLCKEQHCSTLLFANWQEQQFRLTKWLWDNKRSRFTVKSEGLIYVVTSVASQLLPARGDQRMYTHLQVQPILWSHSISDLKKESIARSRFSVLGDRRGSILTPPGYLKLRKVELNRPNEYFLPEIFDNNRIKVGCTCVHILCLPSGRH